MVRKTLREQYKPYLRSLMSFVEGRGYHVDYDFTPEELGQLTPDGVKRWMAMKVYGIEDPDENDNPTHGRSSSMMFWKKAISYFMPNKDMQWNVLSAQGNPTRSRAVNATVQTQLEQNQVAAQRNHALLLANIRRIAAQPGVRVLNPRDPGAAPAHAGVPFASTLSPHPRNLSLLWQEYEHGIGGRKAARLFSREERGRVKHKFCRRNVVWSCIAELVRAGLTSQVACDRIYQVYGQRASVTQIIGRMKRDKQNGSLPDFLQV